MVDEQIRLALRNYLQCLKAHEMAIEPFFAEESPLTLTPDRVRLVKESFDRLEEAKGGYYDALKHAGW